MSSTALPAITLDEVKQRIMEVRHSQMFKAGCFYERQRIFYVSHSDLLSLRREAGPFGEVAVIHYGDLMVYGVLISSTPELGMTKRMRAMEI